MKRENCFHPQHPFHTGSGDHVNAAQILDCALQAAHLHLGNGQDWDKALICQGGTASFQRYIELDIVFEILVSAKPDASELEFTFSQAGHSNASVVLQFKNI